MTKFVTRNFQKKDTILEIGEHKIGGGHFLLIAGPCSVENKEMVFAIAKKVKECGGAVLRGGAYKPRTSPYDFQGLGEEGLRYLREAADEYGLLVVTELVENYADILQIGARNMQNYSLLKKLGASKKPILLKRGLAAKIEELLMAAEYIFAYGNPNIILCERGIRTFETMTRNTVDINAIPLLKELTHLPILIDASHGTGKRSLVSPVTLSDGAQSLDFEMFDILVQNLKKILAVREELL